MSAPEMVARYQGLGINGFSMFHLAIAFFKPKLVTSSCKSTGFLDGFETDSQNGPHLRNPETCVLFAGKFTHFLRSGSDPMFQVYMVVEPFLSVLDLDRWIVKECKRAGV